MSSSAVTYALIRSEIKLQTRQILFYCLSVLAVLFGMFIVQNLPTEKGVLAWGPYYLTKTIITVGFIFPIIQAVFVVKATVRDRQFQLEELVFTTPVSKLHYLLSRWFGVFIPSILVYFAFLIGLSIGLAMLSSSSQVPIDISLLLSVLIWTSLVFIFPAILLSSVLLFALGLFSRSSLQVYLAAGLAFFLYQLLSVITGSPNMAQPFVLNETLKIIFDLLDPMASAEFYKQALYWTVEQRNTLQVILTDSLLFNRLLVLLSAIATILMSYFYFELRLKVSNKLNSGKANLDAPAKINSENITFNPVVVTEFDALAAFKALVKTEYLTTVLTKTFVFIVLAWGILLGSEVISGLVYLESLDVTPVPTTSIAINRFGFDILPTFSALFLVIFSAEIAWRDKEKNIADLIDVTPISNVQRYMAKWFALVCIPLTFITFAIIISMALQWIYGGDIDFVLYSSLYVYVGIPLLCIATLVLFINAVSPNKLVAMVVSLFFIILSQSNLGGYIGLEHGLFKFGHSPQLQHSELVGFSATSDAFWGYMALWTSVSVVLALISFRLMQRGKDVASWSQLLKGNQSKPNQLALATFSVLSIVAGGHVYYQTNIVGNFQSANDYYQWHADYEKKYQSYRELQQPTVVAVKTNMDLYPKQRSYQIKGQYQLQNKTQQPIKDILISTDTDVNYKMMSLENATLIEHDKHFSQYLFKLNIPMQPQQQLTLSFSAERTHNGYNGLISDSAFTPTFIYFRDIRYMPFLGFSEHYVLNSVVKRREFGLPELPVALSLEQDITKYDGDFSHQLKWATIETRITTAENHIAVAPGELISHFKDDNRNVYHYKTKQPIRKIQSVLSGVFMVSERDVDGINVEVYHIEKHTKIAQEHIEAIADTLRYGNQNFGRYPYKQLRLFEVPNVFNQSGYAMPQMMLIDERLGFVVDRSNNQTFDHLYRRTVHETAHQWWGHGLDSAITEGGSVLVETLAVYTQAQLLIQKYGEAYLHRFLQYENNRYLYGRGQSPETEKPLYRADEKHLIYSKGTIAMNAIQKQLGANKVNEALRLVLKKHGYPNKPATTLDFIHALNTVTNFEHQDFIKQWLQQVVVNDWTIESTHVTTLVNGLFSVDVCISNYSTTDNKSQLVELALFSEHPANLFDKPADNRTLLHTKVNVIQPNTCFNFEVLKRPEFIQLDPYYQSIDQQRENNTKRLAVL